MTTSQCGLLLPMLLSGWVSPMEALDRVGCNRLAARIGELERLGYSIERRWATSADGKRWREYRIEHKARGVPCGSSPHPAPPRVEGDGSLFPQGGYRW